MIWCYRLILIDPCLLLGGPSYGLKMDGFDTSERRGLLLWFYDPFMIGNELNTFGLTMDVILGLFWTKTMTLERLGSRLDGGLGLGPYL